MTGFELEPKQAFRSAAAKMAFPACRRKLDLALAFAEPFAVFVAMLGDAGMTGHAFFEFGAVAVLLSDGSAAGAA